MADTAPKTPDGKPADSPLAAAANIPAATTIDAAGAVQQIVPDVDMSHPAVDDNPRARTTVLQNKIDFNDPTVSGADAVAAALNAQGVKTKAAPKAEAAKA